MLIILLLVCISEFTFFMDAEDDFPDRLNTSITLILASVAFLYVASESLPKISYLTLLDKMMLFSFIMLFATALESFVSYILIVWANRPAAAYWVDIGSAIAYPTFGTGATSEHVRRALRADGVMLSLTVLSMYPTLTRSELRVAGRFGRSGQAGLPP